MKKIYLVYEDDHGIIGIVDSEELAKLAIRRAIANTIGITWLDVTEDMTKDYEDCFYYGEEELITNEEKFLENNWFE